MNVGLKNNLLNAPAYKTKQLHNNASFNLKIINKISAKNIINNCDSNNVNNSINQLSYNKCNLTDFNTNDEFDLCPLLSYYDINLIINKNSSQINKITSNFWRNNISLSYEENLHNKNFKKC